MIREQASEFIDVPPDEAFRFMSRVETLSEWLDGCDRAWAITDDPYRVGGRVAHIDVVMGQQFEAHFEVIVWEPGSRMVFKALSGPFDGTSDQTFTLEDGGTRVDIVVEGHLRGAFRFSEWAAKRVARAQLERSVQNAKSLLEKR